MIYLNGGCTLNSFHNCKPPPTRPAPPSAAGKQLTIEQHVGKQTLKFYIDASLYCNRAGIAVLCSDPKFSVWRRVPVYLPGNSSAVELTALGQLCHKLRMQRDECQGTTAHIFCDCDAVVEKINLARRMAPNERIVRKWLGSAKFLMLKVVGLIEGCEFRGIKIELERARPCDPEQRLAHRMARAAAGCASKIFDPRVVAEDDYVRCELKIPELAEAAQGSSRDDYFCSVDENHFI